jgi:hypothetical protein
MLPFSGNSCGGLASLMDNRWWSLGSCVRCRSSSTTYVPHASLNARRETGDSLTTWPRKPPT